MQTNPTIDAYSQYAGAYDESVIEFWHKFPKEFIVRFVDQLPGKRVLDVGSGSGRDALMLRDQNLEVICQDGSKSMVELTTALGFESHLAEFSQLNFPPASFDGIWAYTSLIHIPKTDAEAVIQKLRIMLRPRGTFAIGVIEGDGADMKEHRTMPGALRYFKNYTSDELRGMIEPLGFKLIFQNYYQPHTSVYLNQIYTLNPT